MILEALVKARPNIWLLQIWAKFQSLEFGIPEHIPWVSSVLEFHPTQRVQSAHIGLLDSKWRPEDSGKVYNALLWGYAEVDGSPVGFGPFTREFTYP